ncbi:putative leucine-rich repeat domain superfamily [Helianthus annuus]|uniref:Leucine-rich repeat domain superfamily n=1 Tax=Helianthus annuus TaxID=4232 RepID=A0A9K3HWW0_HELAN|nr:putative leucine-rich repeat domain superfamily [Helianthus annuus]
MLPKIQYLALSDNDFADSFLSILVNLTSLKVIDLCCCHLNSFVPIMPNLLDLDISLMTLNRSSTSNSGDGVT